MKDMTDLNVQDFFNILYNSDNENDIKTNLNNIRKHILLKMLEVSGFLYGVAQHKIFTIDEQNGHERTHSNILQKSLVQDLINDLTEYQIVHLAIEEAANTYPSIIFSDIPPGRN